MSDIAIYRNDASPLAVERGRYSAGECRVNVKGIGRGDVVRVVVRGTPELMELAQIRDIIDRAGASYAELALPYLPYSRQDRYCAEGDSFALRVFADAINAMGWHEVRTIDAHSDVGPALIRRCVNIPQAAFIAAVFEACCPEVDVIVSPDAGAYKKASACAAAVKLPVVVASKTRNAATGELGKAEVHGDVRGKRCLIVDDICDGGRTFIELAASLRAAGASDVELAVTHGIMSRGIVPLYEAGVTRTMTTNSVVRGLDGGYGQGHMNRGAEKSLVVLDAEAIL